MVAPDETTYAYIKDRPRAPKGAAWEQAVAYWKTLPSEADEQVVAPGAFRTPALAAVGIGLARLR